MKRRGFFGALAGLFLAPLGLKRAETKVPDGELVWVGPPLFIEDPAKPIKVPWRKVTRSWSFDCDPNKQAKLDKRARAIRERIVRAPGVGFWLQK